MTEIHPLAAFIDAHGLTYEAFGRRVGLSRVSVHRIVSGSQIPSPESALAIVDATGGAVTLEDLIRRRPVAAE